MFMLLLSTWKLIEIKVLLTFPIIYHIGRSHARRAATPARTILWRSNRQVLEPLVQGPMRQHWRQRGHHPWVAGRRVHRHPVRTRPVHGHAGRRSVVLSSQGSTSNGWRCANGETSGGLWRRRAATTVPNATGNDWRRRICAELKEISGIHFGGFASSHPRRRRLRPEQSRLVTIKCMFKSVYSTLHIISSHRHIMAAALLIGSDRAKRFTN